MAVFVAWLARLWYNLEHLHHPAPGKPRHEFCHEFPRIEARISEIRGIRGRSRS
jgi:hypothetical protein